MNQQSPMIVVALYVRGYELDPLHVTRLLGVAPTRSSKKGEKALSVTNKEVVSRAGLWVLSSDAESDNVSDHIYVLLEKIKNDAKSISSISGVEEAFVDIFIAASSDDDGSSSSSFGLGTDILSSLSELGLPVQITVSVGRD